MMMVLTATPVLHDARTRCLTSCDGQKPAESRGHFRPHGMGSGGDGWGVADLGSGGDGGTCGP